MRKLWFWLWQGENFSNAVGTWILVIALLVILLGDGSCDLGPACCDDSGCDESCAAYWRD